MKKSKILLFILLITLLSPIKSYASYSDEQLDVSIGNIGIGGAVSLESESGFRIIDRLSSEEISIIDEDRINLVVISREESEIRDIKGETIDLVSNGDIIITPQYENPIKINNKDYRGGLSILFTNKGYIINNVSLEEYLYGVLPREMGPSFPREALKAQALASRSFALSNKNKHIGEGFNLCNTTHCQVYGGLSGEHPTSNSVIDETRGEVVYYNGELAETVFHSNNGGYKESSKGAWGGYLGYLEAGEDKYSKGSINSNWEYRIGRDDLAKKLKVAGIDVGKPSTIKILELSDGKRVKSLEIIGDKGEEVISGSRLRSILGPTEFKSNFFTIDDIAVESSTKKQISVLSKDGVYTKIDLSDIYIIDSKGSIGNADEKISVHGLNGINDIDSKTDQVTVPGISLTDEIVFKGHGYGHGVGMSQYGAKTMADQGFNYKDIIYYYFPGVEINR